MSKYKKLWEYIYQNNRDEYVLKFSDVEEICGIRLDHSFLSYKKELLDYGYEVNNISLKEQKIIIKKK